jgi:hypothetical protein
MIGNAISLVAALAMPAAETAPLAVSCNGSSISRSTMFGRLEERRMDIAKQVYVFAETANRVDRVLLSKKTFDPVCKFSDGERSVNFSSRLIQVSSDIASSDARTICSFRFDRETGKAESLLRLEWPDGRYDDVKWEMRCTPTAVPTFDLPKSES